MLLKLADPNYAPPCIRVSKAAKTYRSSRGDVQALAGLDLDIADGEFVSVVGPSGCGKSTLMRCVAGLAPLTSGDISLMGVPVSRPVQNVGIVFQRDLLLDWRTVIDNVLLPAEFAKNRTPTVELRAMKLLEKVGLVAYANRYPWELSGGMRQRVAICRALVMDPPVLLMDEPFGALDALTRDDLNAELQSIWLESRKTVLFITHSISEAAFLSDRVVVMSRNPGGVLEVVEVSLQRPRSLAIRDSADFVKATGRIRQVLAKSGAIRG